MISESSLTAGEVPHLLTDKIHRMPGDDKESEEGKRVQIPHMRTSSSSPKELQPSLPVSNYQLGATPNSDRRSSEVSSKWEIKRQHQRQAFSEIRAGTQTSSEECKTNVDGNSASQTPPLKETEQEKTAHIPLKRSLEPDTKLEEVRAPPERVQLPRIQCLPTHNDRPMKPLARVQTEPVPNSGWMPILPPEVSVGQAAPPRRNTLSPQGRHSLPVFFYEPKRVEKKQKQNVSGASHAPEHPFFSKTPPMRHAVPNTQWEPVSPTARGVVPLPPRRVSTLARAKVKVVAVQTEPLSLTTQHTGKCRDTDSDGKDCKCQGFYPEDGATKCLCQHLVVYHERSL